jgi:hypothetical protein
VLPSIAQSYGESCDGNGSSVCALIYLAAYIVQKRDDGSLFTLVSFN